MNFVLNFINIIDWQLTKTNCVITGCPIRSWNLRNARKIRKKNFDRGRDRTYNLLLRRQTRYPLRHTADEWKKLKGAPSSIIFWQDRPSGSIGQNPLVPVWTFFLSKNHFSKSYGSLKLHSSFTFRLFPWEPLRTNTNVGCRTHTFFKSYRMRPSTIF